MPQTTNVFREVLSGTLSARIQMQLTVLRLQRHLMADSVKILVTIFPTVAFVSVALATVLELKEVQLIARGSEAFDPAARRRLGNRPTFFGIGRTPEAEHVRRLSDQAANAAEAVLRIATTTTWRTVGRRSGSQVSAAQQD